MKTNMSQDSIQIVVLDGYTINPGDLSWSGLESLGNCVVHDRTPTGDILARIREADIVLTNKVVLSAGLIAGLPRLEYIGVLATGFNVVDVEAARSRNIPVTNIPTYGTQSVAQMVFAHLLNFTQRVGSHAESVAEGRWSKSRDWCYWDSPLIELDGLTLGVVGLGRIGRATARLARAFGMSVLAYDVTSVEPPEDVRMVDFSVLLRESDVVSLHCPWTPETEGLINQERLALMKRTAILINTSRGALVNEPALAEALNNDQIAGAGLDVLTVEPPHADNPLLRAKNCQITPHIAWATRAARSRLLQTAVDNVASFLSGEPQNVVN